MRHFNRVAAVCACAVMLAAAGAARADVMLQVIDRGVPTDGTLVMHGFRGYTLRIVSDSPITLVDFDSVTPGSGSSYIAGDLHQRWTDPTNSSSYTVTSPGFIAADNTAQSDLNFDSHYLPPPPGASVTVLSEQFPLFQFRVPFSPVPSTPGVGYADPVDNFDPIGLDFSQNMQVRYTLDPALNVMQIDLAYVVTDSMVEAFGGVVTVDGGNAVGATIIVPEPVSVAGVVVGLFAAALRRTRHMGQRPMTLEPLELRCHLTVAAPEALSVIAAPNNAGVLLTWSPVSDETGIVVERTGDGGQTWAALISLPADTTTYTDTQGLTAAYAYRVLAVYAAESSDPTNPAEVVNTSDAAIALDVEITSTGVRLHWNPLPGHPDWSYRVFTKPRGGATWTLLTTSDLPPATTHYDVSMAPGDGKSVESSGTLC